MTSNHQTLFHSVSRFGLATRPAGTGNKQPDRKGGALPEG